MKNKAQAFWNKQAKKYDNSERQFEAVYKEIISRTKEYLNANDTVLDLGCATGTKTLELAGSTKQILGLDFSEKMINEAIKKKNEFHIVNASFTQGTIFDNDFGEKSFDKVISYGVIHLLDDCEEVIRKIHALLKPGGLFISTTACLKDKMALRNRLVFNAYLLIKRLGLFPLHLNMFKTNDVENLVSNENFQLVRAERIFYGMTISYIVARKP
jgi:2-polyprenyl-3-methyl-5-hydroxy-6-metoxy-1,4-benzoquinol methylase